MSGEGHWGGNSCAFGIGFSSTPELLPPPSNPPNPIPPANELPIGPRTSPPLTSLMLRQQTFRLKLITFPAES